MKSYLITEEQLSQIEFLISEEKTRRFELAAHTLALNEACKILCNGDESKSTMLYNELIRKGSLEAYRLKLEVDYARGVI